MVSGLPTVKTTNSGATTLKLNKIEFNFCLTLILTAWEFKKTFL
jgi:hypothetical protein